ATVILGVPLARGKPWAYQQFVKIWFDERQQAVTPTRTCGRLAESVSRHSKLMLYSYERSGPTSVSFKAAPSALMPGGTPSRGNEKRFTPGGLCSASFGTGRPQSGVGPSTKRSTRRSSGVTTSTTTRDLPSRLTSRIVSGFGSPMLAGFGTVSRAANSALSSVLATLLKASSALV